MPPSAMMSRIQPAACPMMVRGLLTSWAIPAASLPSEAILLVCCRLASRAARSRSESVSFETSCRAASREPRHMTRATAAMSRDDQSL